MFSLETYQSASPVVLGVLITLLIASGVTWTIILAKSFQVWLIRKQNVKFRAAFWGAKSLQEAATLEGHNGPAYRVAQVGFETLKDLDVESDYDLRHSGDRQEVLERALRQQIQKERVLREAGLVVLASIGSTAPFVGLLGTVWGIMHALTDISKLGTASLEVVAGPIGEALVATAIGIAVAVPAVLAYNFFLRRLKTSSNNLDDFAEDLIKVSRRVTFKKPADASKPGEFVSSASASASVVRNLKGATA
jgi:biopolymer transport protein ExbB